MNERLIAERIATLLAHYWTPEMDPTIRSHLATDWLEDLREFPAAIVAAAVQDYRQSEEHRRRPLPGDIRLRCIAIQREQAEAEMEATRPKAIPDLRAQRERAETLSRKHREAAEARDAWARECGFADFRAAMDVGLAAAAKRWRGAAA